MLKAVSAAAAAAILFATLPTTAADDTLVIEVGSAVRSFSAAELLARPDATTIRIETDASYGQPMTYQAVPLAALLQGLAFPADSVAEAIAADGFTAQLPPHLFANTDPARAVAYVAIEEPGKSWPPLPGQDTGPGPLYLVWAGADLSAVRSEHWAWHLARLAARDAPAKRWPEIGVDPALPATDPLRTGQALFVTQCMGCHRLNGGGSADVGPDLNRPANPTETMDAAALSALLRRSAAGGAFAHGLGPDKLSDGEIGLITDYLRHMAGRKLESPT